MTGIECANDANGHGQDDEVVRVDESSTRLGA
jgi:hypothetical protein